MKYKCNAKYIRIESIQFIGCYMSFVHWKTAWASIIKCRANKAIELGLRNGYYLLWSFSFDPNVSTSFYPLAHSKVLGYSDAHTLQL